VIDVGTVLLEEITPRGDPPHSGWEFINRRPASVIDPDSEG
jgi:hypothetical protein